MNMKTLLDDLPLRSPLGDKVYEALCDVHPGETRLELSARRVARAVTASSAQAKGYKQPLEKLLLCGTTSSSMGLWTTTFAETWLGEAWDHSLPFLYVNCGDFPITNPRAIEQLIGPTPINELGQQQPPLFATLESPHFKIRSGKELRVLFGWRDKFLERSKPLETLGRQKGAAFLGEFYIQFNAEVQKIYEKEKDNGPFYSMMFFDGVDNASPMLKRIILGILMGGSVMLHSGRADFSRTVVVASVYKDLEFLGQSNFGFATGQENEPPYQTIRRKLLKDFGGADVIARAMAENIFIMPQRTQDSQTRRVEKVLEALREQYCEDFDVILIFTGEFIYGFVEDTEEETLHIGEKDRGHSNNRIFSEDRIDSGVRRHVLDFIHRLVIAGRLSRGAEIEFSRDSETSKFETVASISQEGSGEAISPEIFGSDKLHDQVESQNLDELVSSNEAVIGKLHKGLFAKYRELTGSRRS